MEKRLLIIDDDSKTVNDIASAMGAIFSDIDRAYSVESAIKFLSEFCYSLIFLDVDLNGRNGAEVIKFLNDAENNSNKNTRFIIMSGLITPQFIMRNQNRFAGILMKPFDTKNLLKTVQEILGPEKYLTPEEIEKSAAEEIPYLKCELPFPIIYLEEKVNNVLNEIKKSAILKKLFTSLKIDRHPDKYLIEHISILVNTSVAIALQMGLGIDETIKKFVHAAYLHDMALAHRPDLARINTVTTLELVRNTLTPSEYQLVFEHANIAANSLQDIKEIPPEVIAIIRLHHELPKETGYPLGCGYQKIELLPAIFIVSHDLTEHIIATPKWTLEDYVLKSKNKFQGSHFTQILKAIGSIK